MIDQCFRCRARAGACRPCNPARRGRGVVAGAWVRGLSACVQAPNHVVQRKNLSLQRKNHVVQAKNLSLQPKNHLVQDKNLSFQSKNLSFQRKNLSVQSLEQRSKGAKVARGWRLCVNKRGGRAMAGGGGVTGPSVTIATIFSILPVVTKVAPRARRCTLRRGRGACAPLCASRQNVRE